MTAKENQSHFELSARPGDLVVDDAEAQRQEAEHAALTKPPKACCSCCVKLGCECDCVEFFSNFTWSSFKNYFVRLDQNFSRKFIIALASLYIGTKGCLYAGLRYNQLPFYRAIGASGAVYGTNSAVSRTPWAMKGFFGAVSDMLPLVNHHKRWYMMIAVVIGSIATMLVPIIPLETFAATLWLPAILFFLGNMQCALCDILTQGLYTRKMIAKPWTGSDIVTYVWVIQKVGSLIISVIQGPLADNVGVTTIYWVLLPISLQTLIPLALNWIDDEPLPRDKWCKPDLSLLKKHYGLFISACLMASAAVGLAVLGLADVSSLVRFIYCMVMTVLMCASCLFLMGRIMALATIYVVLIEVVNPHTSSALDYWYVESDKACVADGTAFDYTYYNTYAQLVGSIFSIVGLWVFQTVMSRWKFRPAVWVSTIIRCVAALNDIFITTRASKNIGLPDQLTFMIGNPIVYEVVYMLDFMPITILISKVCPRNVEATVYAILAGFSNFGLDVAAFSGVYIQQAFGIKTTIEWDPQTGELLPCNYDNLTWYILLSNCLLPILAIPFTFWCIPDARMTDHLVDVTETIENTPEIDPNDVDVSVIKPVNSFAEDGKADKPTV